MSSIISVKDLTFEYSTHDDVSGEERVTRAIDGVSFDVEKGSFVAIAGMNGSGKSTLAKCLNGLLLPSSGDVTVMGYNTRDDETIWDLRSNIAMVFQNPDNQIVTDKVWHELAFGLESLGYDNATIRLRVAEMASYFGIQKWFYKNVSELSGGQKQLLNLASVMAMHPSLLILDEPTSQLDPIAASDFLETVKKINRDIGTTVLLTEHRLQDIIPYADRVFVMDEGTLFLEGKPREIGTKLKEQHHGMFLSMPVPMQIYAGTDSALTCPLTVSEGRQWIREYIEEKGIKKEQIQQANQRLERQGEKNEGFLDISSARKRIRPQPSR